MKKIDADKELSKIKNNKFDFSFSKGMFVLIIPGIILLFSSFFLLSASFSLKEEDSVLVKYTLHNRDQDSYIERVKKGEYEAILTEIDKKIVDVKCKKGNLEYRDNKVFNHNLNEDLECDIYFNKNN